MYVYLYVYALICVYIYIPIYICLSYLCLSKHTYINMCVCYGSICIDIHISFLNQIMVVVVEVLLVDPCDNFEVCNDCMMVVRIVLNCLILKDG